MALDTERREQLVERLARRVAELGLSAPAILFLETYKPLSFLGAQLLWVAEPFLRLGLPPADLRDFTLLLEDRAGIAALIERLETLRLSDGGRQM